MAISTYLPNNYVPFLYNHEKVFCPKCIPYVKMGEVSYEEYLPVYKLADNLSGNCFTSLSTIQYKTRYSSPEM